MALQRIHHQYLSKRVCGGKWSIVWNITSPWNHSLLLWLVVGSDRPTLSLVELFLIRQNGRRYDWTFFQLNGKKILKLAKTDAHSKSFLGTMVGWWNLMLEVWRIDYMHKLGRMATTIILPLIIIIIFIVIIIIVTWRFQFECFVKDKTELAQRVTWSSCFFGFPTQTWLLKNGGAVKEEMLLCIPRRAPQRSAASVSLMPAREKASESLCSVPPPSYLPPDYTTKMGWEKLDRKWKRAPQKVPKIVLSVKITQNSTRSTPPSYLPSDYTTELGKQKHKEGKLLSKTRRSLSILVKRGAP